MRAKLKPLVRVAPSALFVIAVYLLLITASVTYAVNELRLYGYGFDKWDISLKTGIERDELGSIAHQIRAYFNSRTEPLEIRATIFAEERDLFNERETIHMKDVKHLIWGVYVVGGLSLAYLLGSVALGFRRRGRSYTVPLARNLLWGSAVTTAFVLGVGLAALVGFDRLFLFFHQVSFTNDLWMLDPRSDYLVILFPEGFWYDATMFVGLLAVMGAVVIGTASGGYLFASRMREDREAPQSGASSGNDVEQGAQGGGVGTWERIRRLLSGRSR